MIEDATSPTQVARRLRALMLDAGLGSVQQLADLVGAERSAASNWVNGYNLPPVEKMTRLSEELRVNLDWIYRGVEDALQTQISIRLSAILSGEDLQPAPLSAARLEVGKGVGRLSSSARGRRKRLASV